MSRDGSRDSFSVINCVQDYIQKMISVGGMKALLLDDETVSHSGAVRSSSARSAPRTLMSRLPLVCSAVLSDRR